MVLLHMLANIALRAWSRGAHEQKKKTDSSLEQREREADRFAADICQTLHAVFTLTTFLFETYRVSYESALTISMFLMLEYAIFVVHNNMFCYRILMVLLCMTQVCYYRCYFQLQQHYFCNEISKLHRLDSI